MTEKKRSAEELAGALDFIRKNARQQGQYRIVPVPEELLIDVVRELRTSEYDRMIGILAGSSDDEGVIGENWEDDLEQTEWSFEELKSQNKVTIWNRYFLAEFRFTKAGKLRTVMVAD